MRTWGQQYEASDTQRYWPDEELCRFLARMKFPPSAKVLEVGCGNGRNLPAIEWAGLDAYGCDGSAEAISLAIARGSVYLDSRPTLSMRLKTSLLPEIPFEDGLFDAVIDIQCFQHLPAAHLRQSLASVHRVLKPFGKFFSVYLTDVNEGIFPDAPELLAPRVEDYGESVQQAGFDVMRGEWVTRTYTGGTQQATWIVIDGRKLA